MKNEIQRKVKNELDYRFKQSMHPFNIGKDIPDTYLSETHIAVQYTINEILIFINKQMEKNNPQELHGLQTVKNYLKNQLNDR